MQLAVSLTAPPDDLASRFQASGQEQLIGKVAENRDREAFSDLFCEFGPRVKAMMLKSGADAALAEDLVQDVMMKVWQKAEQYKPERGAPSTWIFTIARNTRIDRLRRRSSLACEDVDSMELASTDADAEDELFGSQRAARVSDALELLPQEQREIIELAYLKDMPQSVIANKLSLPLGTVKSRLRLAYSKLRDQLEDLQ